jgi:hypothetical protein
VKQCAVLFIDPDQRDLPYLVHLERIGFLVRETSEWPDDETTRGAECIVVVLRDVGRGAMLAARLRAKPHFGRRVLIAIVPADAPARDRRALEGSGFDEILVDTCHARLLLARLLRRLRERPEFRCLLPPRSRRRLAA